MLPSRFESLKAYFTQQESIGSVMLIVIGLLIAIFAFGPWCLGKLRAWFKQKPDRPKGFEVHARLEDPGFVIETHSGQARTWVREMLDLGRPGKTCVEFSSVDHIDDETSEFYFGPADSEKGYDNETV